jgi:hypothetical protein
MEAFDKSFSERLDQSVELLRTAELRWAAGEEAYREAHQTSSTESILLLEAKQSEAKASMTATLSQETEMWMALQAHNQANALRLRDELSSESRHANEFKLHVNSDIEQLRAHLLAEVDAQKATTALVNHLTRESSSLKQGLREEESAHTFLTEEQRTMSSTLTRTLSDGCRTVASNAELGREELWHVMSVVQDRTANLENELSTLASHTLHVERDKLGELSGKIEEFGTLSGEVWSKMERLENISLKEQVSLTSRLDQCVHDVARNTDMVRSLADKHVDFLESPDSQFRLYVTLQGDVAVYKNNGWGKWGADFKGVPCWHAGAGGTDKHLTGVNREMKDHEKDRFLASANRTGLRGETPRGLGNGSREDTPRRLDPSH